MSEKHIGKVIQVIGPVLDIQFKDGELPELLNAIEIDNHGQKLVVEVAQLTGDNVARCIAMSSTDGLVRGTDAVDTGESIRVPVGDQCLGRVFNLLGEPVDNKPAPTPEAYWPIHRPAPSYEEQQSTTEILETGKRMAAFRGISHCYQRPTYADWPYSVFTMPVSPGWRAASKHQASNASTIWPG